MGRHVVIVMVLVGLCLGNGARAAEGGGRYQPGALSAMALWVPDEEHFAVRLWFHHYEGTMADGTMAENAVPMSGGLASGVGTDEREWAVGLLWRPWWALAGDWTYAAALKLPYVTSEVTARSSANLRDANHAAESGLGDLELIPLMVSRSTAEYWRQQFRLSLIVPTGSYEPGRLANPGDNYWTLRPVFSLSYQEPALGQAFSLHAGIDIHSQNRATDYLSGIQASVESTLSQYVILLGGFTGIGISGYWTQQLTADSGDGARSGSFQGRSLGLGPVLSYRRFQAGGTLSGELKWLTTLDAQRQFDGEMLSFNLSFSY
ncbi:transporter [Photobacterium sp. MCCC 1A19761]|uniref:SphA family protein n=1 Tax=Photobacterium sp. MCCC 1A19761 TaxID=3115000 RepID=UPI00307D6F5D